MITQSKCRENIDTTGNVRPMTDNVDNVIRTSDDQYLTNSTLYSFAILHILPSHKVEKFSHFWKLLVRLLLIYKFSYWSLWVPNITKKSYGMWNAKSQTRIDITNAHRLPNDNKSKYKAICDLESWPLVSLNFYIFYFI